MSRCYEKPMIRTLRADEIVEAMGPVSCGSGAARQTTPIDGSVGPATASPGGVQDMN